MRGLPLHSAAFDGRLGNINECTSSTITNAVWMTQTQLQKARTDKTTGTLHHRVIRNRRPRPLLTTLLSLIHLGRTAVAAACGFQ
jgi:hypothetical protein